jgi:hypothetical protein
MGDAKEANNHAENFERATERYLRQQIDLQTQQQKQGVAELGAGHDQGICMMTEAQLKAQGQPMTPDFLFPDGNVAINGTPVAWIVSAASATFPVLSFFCFSVTMHACVPLSMPYMHTSV